MSTSRDPSGSEERKLLLAQVQLVVESADRYDDHRLTVDKFFIAVISALVLLGGLLSVYTTPPSGLHLSAFGSILILSIIVVLCTIWLEYVRRSYSSSLMKRYVIRALEQSDLYSLPYEPFLMEYKLWRSYNLVKRVLPEASEGRLRRLAAVSTMWPYIIGIVSFGLMILIYLLVIEFPITACGTACGDLDNARVVSRISLSIIGLSFIGSLAWNVFKQSKVARELDEEPDIEALLRRRGADGYGAAGGRNL